MCNIDRVTGAPWTVRAGAVVLATGGCAFMSHLLGCHTNTGDGALMAAEAGAEFSGMEFSAYYTVAPAFSTMTRSMSYASCQVVLWRSTCPPRKPGHAPADGRAGAGCPAHPSPDRGWTRPGLGPARAPPNAGGRLMIELLVTDRCTACNICVQICPTNVFDAAPGAPPAIARQADCQTCFMCELYCPADALYVAPDCDGAVGVDEAEIVASGWLGQYRRDSGWGEFRGDPAHANESWRMDEVFARARAMAPA